MPFEFLLHRVKCQTFGQGVRWGKTGGGENALSNLKIWGFENCLVLTRLITSNKTQCRRDLSQSTQTKQNQAIANSPINKSLSFWQVHK